MPWHPSPVVELMPRALCRRGGVGLSAQSQHLALACGRRRCVSTPHWRTPRHLSGALCYLEPAHARASSIAINCRCV